MRLLVPVLIFLCAISCAKKPETSGTSSDSTVTVSAEDGTTPESTSSNLSPGPHPTWGQLSFEPDLFITETLDSSVSLLKKQSIAIADIDAYTDEWDSLKAINFDDSRMTFYRGDGLYYLHTVDINASGFPFKHGLTIGMPRRDALAILGIDSTLLQAYGEVDRYQHEWDMNSGSGDTMLYTFKFSKSNFVGVSREYQNMD